MCPIIAIAPFADEQLQNLILCIAGRAPSIGITKLEKLMYLCDFASYEKLGKPITEDTYKRFQLGPVPKHFVPAYEELKKTGKLIEETITLANGKPFKKITVKDQCDAKAFSPEQWQVIEQVLGEHGNKSAEQLVKLTHDEAIWDLLKANEEIPYFLAEYRTYTKPSKEQIDTLLKDPDYIDSLKRQLA
jgi:uncharacterized phage-associated protein